MANGDEKQSETVITHRIYNQLIRFAHDDEYKRFVDKQRKKLKSRGKKLSAKDIAACRREIKKFLRDKKIPLTWVEPVYKLIKDNKFDYPSHGGIHLKVGDDDITYDNEVLLIKDKQGKVVSHDSISVVITAKTSTEAIIRFIKDYQGVITYFQDFIELPKLEPLNWKDTNLALKVIRMKDEEGMTYSEIASRLLDDDELNIAPSDKQYWADTNYLKKLYNRYKKRLSPQSSK